MSDQDWLMNIWSISKLCYARITMKLPVDMTLRSPVTISKSRLCKPNFNAFEALVLGILICLIFRGRHVVQKVSHLLTTLPFYNS